MSVKEGVGSPSAFLRSSAVIGALTLISRVTGFIRELLVASAFGTTVAASALVLAQTVPNLSRSLASEDVAHGTLVPTLADLRREGAESEARRLAVLCALWATVMLAVLAVAIAVLSQAVVDLISPGLSGDGRELTATLLVLLCPVIVFNGLLGAGSAMLVSDGRFGVVGAAGVASNIPVLVGLVTVPGISVRTVALLLVAGYALQAVVLGHFAFVAGKARSWRGEVPYARLRPDLMRVARLAPPIVVSLGMASLSGVVDMAFSSLVSSGAPAALDKGFRLIMLPYGVFAMAIGVVALPRLAAAASRPDDFDQELLRATRLQAALLLPLAVAAVLMADPVVRLVYERGAFNSESSSLTSSALVGVSFALPALGLSLVGSRAWLSRKRPGIPAALASIGLIANAGLDAALIGPFGVAGIGVATGIVHAAVGLALILSAGGNRRAMVSDLSQYGLRLAGLVGASALIGWLAKLSTSVVATTSTAQWTGVAVAATVFVIAAGRCGISEYGELGRAIRRRPLPSR